MRTLWTVLALAAGAPAVAAAQTTDCQPRFVGNPTQGFTCTTSGSANNATDTSAGAAVAAGAVIGLGVLIARGMHTAHQRKDQEIRIHRATRVAALAEAHDCLGAQNLAYNEHDPDMAHAVESMCKTVSEAGEQPAFAPSDGHVAWAKTYLHYDPSSVLSANDSVLVLKTDRPPNNGQLWVREEALSPEGAKGMNRRSQLMLAAFNCTESTFSIKATTVYAGNNLTGEARSSDGASPSAAVRPGSFADAWGRAACSAPARVTRLTSPP